MMWNFETGPWNYFFPWMPMMFIFICFGIFWIFRSDTTKEHHLEQEIHQLREEIKELKYLGGRK